MSAGNLSMVSEAAARLRFAFGSLPSLYLKITH